MIKRAALFFAFTLALFAGYSQLNCLGQSRSLEDLQAEIRAGVRRDMGLNDASSYNQKAISLPEKTSTGLAQKKKIDMPVDDSRPKIVLAIVITAAVTFFLTSILGGVKKKKPKRNDPEPEKRDQTKKEINEYPANRRTSWPEISENIPREETAIDIYEKIERIQALRNRGVLSEEEFSAKKKELLGRI